MNKRVYISGAIAHHDISERKTTFADAEAAAPDGLRACQPVQERLAGRGALA